MDGSVIYSELIKEADSDFDLHDIMKGIPNEQLVKVYSDPSLKIHHRALIARYVQNPDLLLGSLEELGLKLTKIRISDHQNHNQLDYFNSLHQAIVTDLLTAVASFDQLNRDIPSSTDDIAAIGSELVTTLGMYDFQQSDDRFDRLYRFLQALVCAIYDLETVVEWLDSLSFLDTTVLERQLLLIITPYLHRPGKTVIELYEAIISDYPEIQLQIGDFDGLPIEGLKALLRYEILPDLRKLTISEINDPEILANLLVEGLFQNDLDLVVPKLDKHTLYHLIQNQNQSMLIHKVKDLDLLRELFYEIDRYETKVGIARKLRNPDLIFQVLDLKFNEEPNTYLPKTVMRELIVELNKKQLMLLRLSAPPEVQQFILDMVEKREHRESYDNDVFI